MSDSAAYGIGALVGDALLGAVVIGLIVVVVGLIVRGSRRTHASGTPQIPTSHDGRYWWDGTNWQDATTTVPPYAPRSPDGAYWWDGNAWHQVPRVA